MKAARINRFGGPEVITFQDIPLPEPGPGELRIRVQAASVNPVDYKIREGGFLPEDKLPMTLGRDIAGIVDKRGSDNLGAFREGESVYAMLDPEQGGYAEYALARPEICAPKPQNLDADTAASVGLAALTAWQGLFDHGGLTQGQRVLIHGAAGGVGHLAVQFAVARGAEVFATCAGDDAAFVQTLGAHTVIDYRKERFEDRATGMDVVLDLIAGETQERSWAVLRDGGILVSTLSEPDPAKAGGRHVRGTHYMAKPDGSQLLDIGQMIEDGRVRPHVARVMPLDAAAEAHRVLEHQHIRGKLVLHVA